MATELKNSLKERGIKTIIISGALTNLCCEDTVRAAFNHDFAVFFLGECTAASTKEMQKASLLNLKYGYAVIYTVNEIVKGIETAAIENKIKVPFGNGLKNKEEGGKPDQPNNPPSFPPPQPNQKESPIQERVKQFLAEGNIPDLNSTQRVGVIKGLTILVNKEEEKNNPFFPLFQEQKGNCHELVVVARKTASDSQNDPTINIDGRIWNEVEETYFREIITSPLPNNLAATGEIAIKDNKILAVGGLKGKITAAFNQGVRKLVLPQDNSTPNGTNLENFFLEIYQQQVPPEIREKMTVH
ncbi:7292_t:CDS:2 [Ambispora leptoticha]|uniref:7292_t:CDS:1 n=1 Tax=Ambispora leptoticha TaxID=144679 RepID=A0A9N9F6M4_9GLOM|nr:7292_t:CDS:2 [Ambispora leptoticha]